MENKNKYRDAALNVKFSSDQLKKTKRKRNIKHYLPLNEATQLSLMFQETLGWRYFSLLQGADLETDSLQHESVCPLSPLFVNTNEKSNYHLSRLVRVSACPRKWVYPGDARWSWQKSAGKNGTTIRNTAEARWPRSFRPADWPISTMMQRGHGEAASQWKERDRGRMSKKRSHGRKLQSWWATSLNGERDTLTLINMMSDQVRSHTWKSLVFFLYPFLLSF